MDIIVFAFVAGFVIYRLYSVLGTDNDIEVSNNGKVVKIVATSEGLRNVTKEKDLEIENEDVSSIISKIKKTNPNFMVKNFIEGAKTAFEMILNAFSKKDKKILKKLLSEEVYENFSSAIDENGEEIEEHTLISIKSANIKDASLEGNMAYITTEFETEQITVIKDKAGKVVGGNPSQIHSVTDLWTFCRDITALNPNWKLVATSCAV